VVAVVVLGSETDGKLESRRVELGTDFFDTGRMTSSEPDPANESFPAVVLEEKFRLVACGFFLFDPTESSRGSTAELFADFLVVADGSFTRLLSGSKEKLPAEEVPDANCF